MSPQVGTMHAKTPVRTVWNVVVRGKPLEAQLIVTRRCNLSCGYCTEFDNTSSEIPFETLATYIDALHRLEVAHISMLGGEPLMHSRIADLVARANRHAEVSITTNGFLLSDELIHGLNDAGLNNMQVSIDTLRPDSALYIQKSMKSIAPKLKRLRELARFGVHANVVLCDASRDQFRPLLQELRALGLHVTVNLIHAANGEVEIANDEFLALWEHHYQEGMPLSFVEYEYGRDLLRGKRPDWTCRSGSRYLYVDEFGRVQFCSSQRGRLDKPLLEYTKEDLRQHRTTKKGCEEGCAIFCVFRASQLDNAPIQLARAVYRAIRA